MTLKPITEYDHLTHTYFILTFSCRYIKLVTVKSIQEQSGGFVILSDIP